MNFRILNVPISGESHQFDSPRHSRHSYSLGPQTARPGFHWRVTLPLFELLLLPLPLRVPLHSPFQFISSPFASLASGHFLPIPSHHQTNQTTLRYSFLMFAIPLKVPLNPVFLSFCCYIFLANCHGYLSIYSLYKLHFSRKRSQIFQMKSQFQALTLTRSRRARTNSMLCVSTTNS